MYTRTYIYIYTHTCTHRSNFMCLSCIFFTETVHAGDYILHIIWSNILLIILLSPSLAHQCLLDACCYELRPGGKAPALVRATGRPPPAPPPRTHTNTRQSPNRLYRSSDRSVPNEDPTYHTKFQLKHTNKAPTGTQYRIVRR